MNYDQRSEKPHSFSLCPQKVLVWWVDYIAQASEAALIASLQRFKAFSERLAHLTGATVDG